MRADITRVKINEQGHSNSKKKSLKTAIIKNMSHIINRSKKNVIIATIIE